MTGFKQVPLLKIAIPFLLGIVSFVYFPFYYEIIKYIIFCFALCLLYLHIKNIGDNFAKRWLFGIFTQALLFLFGVWLAGFYLSDSGVSVPVNNKCIYIATVVEPVSEKEKNMKTFLEFDFFRTNNKLEKSKGKALAYFQKDSSSLFLEPGDQIVFSGILTEIKNPGNPYEFDYKTYLSYHKVSQQIKVKSRAWKLLKKNNGNPIFIYASKIQKYLLGIFKRSGISGDEYAVASALIIGYTDKIDTDTKKSYSATGAMHILSVSGLHVGIIFIIFNFLFRFIEKIKHGKIIKAVILIFILWFYASITGLSAAVIRAAAMFSFVVIGKSLNRHVNIINTISASALLLLVINPMYLFDIGFQLSYLAVIGIVLYQQKIYNLLYVKNWLLDKVWALIVVSIAAQIATLPVTLYHFHQFPNYFLLTNILVIPISTVVLYLGLAVFSFSFIEVITVVLGKILAITVKILNETIKYIEHLPYALSENININSTEAVLIFMLIIFISLFVLSKKVKYLSLALVSLILVAFVNIYTTFKIIDQKEIIAYNIPGGISLDIINGNKDYLITDIEKNDRRFQIMQNAWTHMGITKHLIFDVKGEKINLKEDNFFIKNNFIFFNEKKIGIVDEKEVLKIYKKQLQLDYIFLTGSKFFSINNFYKNYKSERIILVNVSKEMADKIVMQSPAGKESIYIIEKKGCFKGFF